LNATNGVADTIAFTSGAGIVAAADRVTVNGFGVNDIIALDDAQTTTGTNAMTVLTAPGAVTVGTGANNILVYSFEMGGSTNVLGGDLTGASLLANAGGAITDTAGDDGYIIAYDGGNAYLYAYVDAGTAGLVAAEIILIGIFNGVAIGAIGTANVTQS
jgi:hypothetical protein